MMWDKEAFMAKSFKKKAGKQAFECYAGKGREGFAMADIACNSSVCGAEWFEKSKIFKGCAPFLKTSVTGSIPENLEKLEISLLLLVCFAAFSSIIQ